MKCMIASDIHGSALYCRQLVEAWHTEGEPRLVLLGDILYHGPRNPLPEGYAPQEVASLLNPMAEKILAVRGNCDAEIDQVMLDFPMMADYAIMDTSNTTLFITHGHLFDAQNPPKLAQGGILLHGHTHVPQCQAYKGFVYINPGSVTLPKEDSCRSYLVLEDGIFTWKALDGTAYKHWNSKTEAIL